jgi:hypothetical protein
MADFQAIGSVSATLQTLLQDRMDFPADLLPAGQPVTVTVDAPPLYEAEQGAAPAELPQVNLFLYRVAENSFLKNQEIPGRGSSAYGAPPLSLELFYLLTAYGRTAERPDIGDSKLAQYLLGSAMRVFHDFPVVTDSLARHASPVIGDPILDARLAGEFEQLRLCLYPLSLEDLTKVWTALAQPYRLSAAYVVSATQIESRRPRRFPRPVGEPPAAGPRIAAVTLARPEITELRVIRGGSEHPYPNARIGDTLVVLGHGFIGTNVSVAIGSIQIAVTPTATNRIEVVVPDAVLPDGTAIPTAELLQPGVHAVRVLIGVEAMPQVAFESNEAAFMLVPTIVAPVVADMPTADPQLLHVQGLRLWHERLPGQSVIGRSVIPAAAYTAAAPSQIDVPVPDRLPRSAVRSHVGDNASGFGGSVGSPELEIRIGAVGNFHTVSLAPMPDLETAARLLGAAIRGVTDGGAAYARARVTVVRGGAGDARLVIVPGGLRAPITVQTHLGDAIAANLGLIAPGAVSMDGYLSGELEPFPKLSAASPKLQMAIGGNAKTIAMVARPESLADAANSLQGAIRNAAAGDANFAATYVAVLGRQLLVIPRNGLPLHIDVVPAPGADATSARELQFRADYAVRVRVNGAESLDDAVITLP